MYTIQILICYYWLYLIVLNVIGGNPVFSTLNKIKIK